MKPVKMVTDFGRAAFLLFAKNKQPVDLTELEEAGGGEPSASRAPAPWYVLAIDDDQEFLEALRLHLVPAGFKLMSAASPAHGLDLLRYSPNKVRVIILDYNMPGLNGSEALKWVRKLSPSTKVLGLTGTAKNDLPDSFCKGVDTLLTKPCPTVKLVQELRISAMQYRDRLCN